MIAAKKEIRLNALDMMCMGCTPGIWKHARDESHGYNTIAYWTKLARILEKGKFDSLFIADIYGVYNVYRGGPETAFREAVEFPVCDPMMVVSAMAAITEHLGFGVTGTLSYEPPFSFARRVSTLDHLTGGRFAWNIVTGYLASAARGFGLEDQLSHDERYDMGDEYMEVVYKLWEGSWEDGAVLRDKENGVFANPEKMHPVEHKGRFYECNAYHLCEPSPQRTPVLFQAGASKRGRQFAAKHAECVFISALTPENAAAQVKDIREQAKTNGRDPNSIIIYNGLTAITGATDKDAQAKFDDYRRHVSVEGTLSLFGGYTGVDFSSYDLDATLDYFESNAIQTFVEGFTKDDPDRQWTLREIAEFLGVGGFAPIEIGSPETIADAMEHWMEVSGIDGFNLLYSVTPGDMSDFIELVVPELQARGIFKKDYSPGTLREKLSGQGNPLLPPEHPAASYRRS